MWPTRNRTLLLQRGVPLTLLLALAACGVQGGAPPTPAPVDSAAPAVPAPKVDLVSAADLATLLKSAEGKVVVLNFWATWCPPCVEEMPALADYFRESRQADVAFLSLSADDPATVDQTVQKFQREHKLPFDVHVLSERDPDALAGVLGGEISGALPTTLVFDRTGKRVLTHDGMITAAALREAVQPLL